MFQDCIRLREPCSLAAAPYNWLKQQVCKYEAYAAGEKKCSPYELINEEAAQSPPGSNGVIFLPYLLGERAPRWNPDATVAWLRLKMENQRADLLRAVLEGVAMNLNVILESFRKPGNVFPSRRFW